MKAKSTKLVALAGLALAAAGIATFQSAGSPASADPQEFNKAIVGVGSDTVQDVVDAFAGYSGGQYYAPLNGGTSSNRQIISFDAIKPAEGTETGNCIIPRLKGASLTRPNGSGAGLHALSDAYAVDSVSGLPLQGYGNGTLSGGTTADGCKVSANVVGKIDFARSSSAPETGFISGTSGPKYSDGTDLTYIPFGQDAVSWAYYSVNNVAVTALSKAQLNTLYSNGVLSTGGVTYNACFLNALSGTYNFFLGKLGLASVQKADPAYTTEHTAMTASHCSPDHTTFNTNRIEENTATSLVAKAATNPGEVFVVPFSAAAWIAKSNGVATTGGNPFTLGVGLGNINDDGSGGATPVDLGSPYTGTTIGSFAPANAFYASTIFSRKVWTIVATDALNPAKDAYNPALVTLFVNTAANPATDPNTSKVCLAGATIQSFGFKTLGASCGTTTDHQSFHPGQT